MMNYNMAASRALVAALGEVFGEGKFDEYVILANKPGLPLKFLNNRRVPQRVCIATWLRSVAGQNIGLVRDPDNPTWFKVLPVTPGTRGIAERDSSKSNSV